MPPQRRLHLEEVRLPPCFIIKVTLKVVCITLLQAYWRPKQNVMAGVCHDTLRDQRGYYVIKSFELWTQQHSRSQLAPVGHVLRVEDRAGVSRINRYAMT